MMAPDLEDRLRQRLSALREELPDDGFEAQLHRRLVAEAALENTKREAPFSRWRSLWWPLSGVAAGVASYFILTLLQPVPTPSSVTQIPVVAPRPVKAGSEVPVTKVAVLKLNFTVDADVEEADFQVSLPEGLVFWVEGEALAERAFRWTQGLKEGSNVVPIAVRGNKPGLYTVSAKARIGDTEVVHDVVLEVTSG